MMRVFEDREGKRKIVRSEGHQMKSMMPGTCTATQPSFVAIIATDEAPPDGFRLIRTNC